MKINKQIIEKFNQKDTLVMISSYPSYGKESAKLNAVACYSQNLLSEYKNCPVVVLAEAEGDSEYYVQENVLVIKCWKPQSPFLFLQIFYYLLKFNKSNKVLIQFEFNMLGSFIHTAMLPFFIAILKIIGKRVTIMQHQVVANLADLSGHLNIKKNSLKNKILTAGMQNFYKIMGTFADSIIVHEEYLKSKLAKFVTQRKIFVISHGLELSRFTRSNKDIREEIGVKEDDFVLLIFGYIAWYKGTDWIIEKVGKLSEDYPNIKLIVAGGHSATLKSKSHYLRYIKKVDRLAKKYQDNVIMTGFVPEEKVEEYFNAADVVVLPYRTMMSASGPLSFALRFKKPFLFSDNLKHALANQDFASVIENKQLDPNKLMFTMKNNSLDQRILELKNNKQEYSQLVKLVDELRELRKWGSIVFEYEKVVNRFPKVETSTVGLRGALSRILSLPFSLVLAIINFR